MKRGPKPYWAKRLLDFTLYFVIALALGLGAIWWADHPDGVSDDDLLRWGGLGLNTVVLYGIIIWDHRWFGRHLRFWIAVGALLIAHLCVFVFVLFRVVEHRTPFWFVVAYPCEIVAFEAILGASGIGLLAKPRR